MLRTRQHQWLATSSRLIVIECTRLKQATVVAMVICEAGGDTAVDESNEEFTTAWLALGSKFSPGKNKTLKKSFSNFDDHTGLWDKTPVCLTEIM